MKTKDCAPELGDSDEISAVFVFEKAEKMSYFLKCLEQNVLKIVNILQLTVTRLFLA